MAPKKDPPTTPIDEELEAMRKIVATLEPLDAERRSRVFGAVLVLGGWVNPAPLFEQFKRHR